MWTKTAKVCEIGRRMGGQAILNEEDITHTNKRTKEGRQKKNKGKQTSWRMKELQLYISSSNSLVEIVVMRLLLISTYNFLQRRCSNLSNKNFGRVDVETHNMSKKLSWFTTTIPKSSATILALCTYQLISEQSALTVPD